MKSRTMSLFPLLISGVCLAQATPPTAPVPPVPPAPMAPRAPPHFPGRHPGGRFGGAPGIPPHLAHRLGIAPEVVKKVQDQSFDANEALITLEADLKRAQLDLERTLAQAQIEEAAVMAKLEAVSKTELAVRKNRMGLMVRIRKLVGPEAWEKLQAEMPGPERRLMHSPGGEPGNPHQE